MLMLLDIFTMFMLCFVMLLLLSGFLSLFESKMMAMLQLSVGPSIFLFGLMTPLFDGLKLFLKFNLLTENMEILYFMISITFSFLCLFLFFLLLPISNIMLIYMTHNIFMLLMLHLMYFIMWMYTMGYFMLSTVYVYMSTVSSMLCSMMSDMGIMMINILFFMFNWYEQNNLLEMGEYNIFMSYMYLMPMTSFFPIIILFLLFSEMCVFEYGESEAEIVTGFMTEFSGIFFAMHNMLESFIMFYMMVLNMSLFLGTHNLIEKSMCILFFFYGMKMFNCSMKLSIMMSMFLSYVYMYLMFQLMYELCMKYFMLII